MFADAVPVSVHKGVFMLSIFVDPKKTVRIEFVVAASKTEPDFILADATENDLLENFESVDPGTVEHHWVDIRMPNFDDQVSIMSDSVSFSKDGIIGDPSAIQFSRMKKLIVGWSFGQGVSEEAIKQLSPVVAMVINAGIEKVI